MVEGKMCDMLNHEKEYGDYILDVTSRLLAVDSPSGLTAKAARSDALALVLMPPSPS